ncbi:unnamed protein product [Effrenium voratum]|uniref:Uncharacterized protein n=1 Tax=Effrenium voratum TaxID=2562239 RepID=A0AA36HKI0_9DINO|nr:unnamed protein product [Effrenium voratum]CAJ1413708.1 unnamed protein product [Effrenium voratum]
MPPPIAEEEKQPAWGVALWDFDGSAYGEGYLSFNEGQELGIFTDEEADGWAFGSHNGNKGWFPPDFWGAGSSLAPPRTCGLHSSPDARWSTRREKSLVRQEKRGSGSGSSCEFAEGVVKIFFMQRRFGFIECNGLDVFLHLSDCGSHVPRVGDGVRFTIERRAANPKQLQAKSVTFTGRQSSISQNQTGVVKSISSNSGFISAASGGDVFFLISNCKEGMPMPGDTVTFDVKWSETRPGSLEAVNMVVIATPRKMRQRSDSIHSSQSWKDVREEHPSVASIRDFAAVLGKLADRTEAAESEAAVLRQTLQAAEKRITELEEDLRTRSAKEQTPERTA